jgi:hypothetical protein
MSNTTIGEIGANELVFNTDKEEGVFSGGFNVNSIMMKSGLSPIMTLNTQLGGGDSNKVSDLFQSLVIPNWALTYGNKVGGEYKDEDSDSDSDIDDELHDKLLGMVREHENKLKQQNQNNQNNKNRKTKKQKTSVNTKKGGTRRRK